MKLEDAYKQGKKNTLEHETCLKGSKIAIDAWLNGCSIDLNNTHVINIEGKCLCETDFRILAYRNFKQNQTKSKPLPRQYSILLGTPHLHFFPRKYLFIILFFPTSHFLRIYFKDCAFYRLFVNDCRLAIESSILKNNSEKRTF